MVWFSNTRTEICQADPTNQKNPKGKFPYQSGERGEVLEKKVLETSEITRRATGRYCTEKTKK